MPLIVVCGIPCSGKTTCAKLINEHLNKLGKNTHIINEESLHIQKSIGYKDSAAEKMTRGAIKAAVERTLSSDITVICDSLNYIKGFRYELFCLARACGTPIVCLWLNTSSEICKEWNQERGEGGFPPILLEEITFRFEPPNPKNRWDSPLFILPSPEHPIPFDEIYSSLYEKSGPKPNLATEPQMVSDTNFVFELEQTTQQVINSVMENAGMALPGDTIPIPKSKRKFLVKGPINLGELRRMRKQYFTVAQLRPPPVFEIADSFVGYLNTTL